MRVFIFLLLLFTTPAIFAQIKYPDTRKVNQEDHYFGTVVKDPYRWLEDDNSADTKEWVQQQNKITGDYLSKIPFREAVKQRLASLWNYERYGIPGKEGDYIYYTKNDGLQNQSVWYRQKGLDGSPEIFIDPNKMSPDGTLAIGSPVFSKNYKYAAYLESQSGSDWEVARVMSADNKTLLADKIEFIKFSGISWKGDDGFYYSRYPVPDDKDKLTSQNRGHKIFYHKIGDPQTADQLVYEDKEHPLRIMNAFLSEDNRFLFISKSEGSSGNELWVKDLSKNPQDFTLLKGGFTDEADFIDNTNGKLLIRTNVDAPNFRVVLADPENPSKDKWQVVIPERKELLSGVSKAGGKLFLSYLQDAASKVYCTDYQGHGVREIALPGIGTASGFSGHKNDKEIFYSYSSFDFAPAVFRYDIASGRSALFRKSGVQINTDNYQTVQSFFTSKDGTKIPMFITYKKGIRLDGNNPVLMYGYGGFNIPMTPGFSVANAFFLEQGGVYVVVNLRGGNEYGEGWHKGGMLQNKQHVFDDFIAAAQFLIDKKYTNPSRLAVRGGSNGGLLIGAVMTQRPDLFKVAIPQVGVMDMLRYHKFTIGWAWVQEYGSSDKKEDFENLIKYSPLHNLKPGVAYPATLVTTADHDDRVVPAHSFKFAATLQADQAGNNPVLIRIDSKAGHGGGKPTAKQIEETADIWSFVMYNLGMTFH